MDFNTLAYNPKRYPSSWIKKEFLTPGDQNKFINDFKSRKQSIYVSWDGGKTY